jgi:hypothetical protein
MEVLSVVTWLWDDPNYRWNGHFRYGADHVRRLRASVARNLSMPHRFVLVTDQPDSDYGPGVEIVPLWNDFARDGGCYRRLKAFDRETAQRLGERFVWLDLDTVIMGPLDSLFNRDEPFVAWRDVNPPTPYCGSMIMMNAGARQQVWDQFIADPNAARARAQRYIGTDQAWIGECLGTREPTWGPEDGVYNFKKEVANRGLPDNARIVFFTGPVDPSQAEIQRRHPWVLEHWRTL